jgi:UDP-glucose 4-epimerase
MKILVTGGAGYIGSHTVKMLHERGDEVVVFDNLVYGHEEAVAGRAKLVEVFKGNKFDGCIHFAAYCAAGESVANPAKYFENNVSGSVNLLKTLVKYKVERLVFSSSCSVYGQPKTIPVSEKESKKPESPYGESKWMTERIMEWFGKAYGLKSIALRYFNASGASPDNEIGDEAKPATRLIPIAIEKLLGQGGKFILNGTDYPTPDGTCIRDYIHVMDLADGHLKALVYLEKQSKEKGVFEAFNLGTGKGNSNKEVIKMTERVSGKKLEYQTGPRRPGDPAKLWADNRKARKVLGWKPKYGLKEIIETDWRWHSTHPKGYAK